jgi:hypothetical protein
MANLQLSAQFVALCEGPADKAFLLALRAARHLPPFDVPFPPDQQQPGQPSPHGRDGFVQMLRDLADIIRLDPSLDVRGIVVVADTSDTVSETLKLIQRQCRRVGFDPPPAQNAWSRWIPPLPPVAIVLVPDGDPGGLETLCLTALRPRHPRVASCLDSFLACVPPIPRTAEKRDKAALASFTAAMHPDDPTRTLARLFSGQDALIDVGDAAFNEVADRLTALFSSVVPLPIAP